MTGQRIPTVMGELLQDPAVLEWLQARDAETFARCWSACVDVMIEVARSEGASAAMLTAFNEVGSRDRALQVAAEVLDYLPARVWQSMEQSEA